MDNLAGIKTKLGETNYQKLIAINNPKLHQFIVKYVKLCNPDKIFVATDSPEDIKYIRDRAIENGEESRLSGTIEGHTVHFDSYYDQGRDKEHTGILVPASPGSSGPLTRPTSLGSSGPLTRADVVLEPLIETKPRTEGLNEIQGLLKDIMKGKELYICFFCLGPTNSEFSIPAVQLTDSSYVAHSENLLYRVGYEEFKRQGKNVNFFSFVHSAGELDEKKVCKNIAQRRIYIDCEENIVYSVNTQYGGNTIGLKKLAMRLAIRQASKEGWLTEHMLIMGVYGPNKRKTYFTGAFPSLCGKTSTAMLDNGSIVGDDIAYLRKINGKVRAVNVEKGMFGIIQGVNSKDDPIQWKALHTPGQARLIEVIFSNILVTESKGVHWIGKNGEIPAKGYNHSGEWWLGKKDAQGKEIKCSHPNARFTIKLNSFENLDPEIDAPEGVEIGGIVYGGRDSDTWVPVCEAFDWVHGIITKGASLESETTAATLGKEGVREFNPMSNLDFLSIPIGKYIQDNLNFGKNLSRQGGTPLIFGVNYFLKDRDATPVPCIREGNFLNEKTDKKVWYKWMELRVHKEVDAIDTPTGRIPEYKDLKKLFKEVLGKDYSIDDYNVQFTLRIPENIAKIERITNIYNTNVFDTPKIIFEVLEEEKRRLISAKEKFGDYITPDKFIVRSS